MWRKKPVLNVSERGDRAFIGIHPEARLDHPWAGNVVDLCPVGSLLSKDFLHKARAWELDKTASSAPAARRVQTSRSTRATKSSSACAHGRTSTSTAISSATTAACTIAG